MKAPPMSRSVENSAQRQARLAEIRRQIAEGTYETPERIAAAVEKMLERLEPLSTCKETAEED